MEEEEEAEEEEKSSSRMKESVGIMVVTGAHLL